MLKIRFLGHSTFLLDDGQHRLLIDPFIEGNPQCPVTLTEALGWQPKYDPKQAVAEAARWYADNQWWWEPIRSGEFREYYNRQYAERLAGAAQK